MQENHTPASLLARLRSADDTRAWERFVELYTPVVLAWCRIVGLKDHDAADLTQEVFLAVFQAMPSFTYDPTRKFRHWLRTITLNRWRDRRKRRADQALPGNPAALEVLPATDEGDAFWEVEYRQHLVARTLRVMQSDFAESTWKACWEHVVNSRPAPEVARELGLSIGAVYAARIRVLARLRQELDGLLD